MALGGGDRPPETSEGQPSGGRVAGAGGGRGGPRGFGGGVLPPPCGRRARLEPGGASAGSARTWRQCGWGTGGVRLSASVCARAQVGAEYDPPRRRVAAGLAQSPRPEDPPARSEGAVPARTRGGGGLSAQSRPGSPLRTSRRKSARGCERSTSDCARAARQCGTGSASGADSGGRATPYHV